MEFILRLNQETISDYVKFIPRQFMGDYIQNDKILIYGIKDENSEFGVAVLETDVTEVLIQYIYVEPHKSRFLYTFINTISRYVYELGFEQMKWKFIDDEENSYTSQLVNMGFVIRESDIAVFNFTIKALSEAEILKAPSHNVISLEELDGVSLKKICAEITDNGKDIINMPVTKSEFIADCSAVYMENNIPKGILLLQQTDKGSLKIPFIYSSSKKSTSIIEMMRFAFKEASLRFDADEICSAYIVEPVLVKIVERVTGIKGKYQQIGIRDFKMMEFIQNKIKNI